MYQSLITDRLVVDQLCIAQTLETCKKFDWNAVTGFTVCNLRDYSSHLDNVISLTPLYTLKIYSLLKYIRKCLKWSWNDLQMHIVDPVP